jgi:hypothetical protein
VKPSKNKAIRKLKFTIHRILLNTHNFKVWRVTRNRKNVTEKGFQGGGKINSAVCGVKKGQRASDERAISDQRGGEAATSAARTAAARRAFSREGFSLTI